MTGTTGTKRVLVDSSGWLEALTEDTKAELFKPYILRERELIVPTIVIYEVYKKLVSFLRKSDADHFHARVSRCNLVHLDENIAAEAALLSLQHKLPMADAIIYATAQTCEAELITADPDFSGLPGVTLL